MILIYAIAHTLDETTRSLFLNASSLGMEYHAIIDNLALMGIQLHTVSHGRFIHA